MDKRRRLVMSVLAGALAMMFCTFAVEDVRAQAARAEREVIERYGGELAPVCVAIRQIEPGEVIDERNVQAVDWMASLLPADALVSMSEVVGKKATSRIPEGAPLCSAYFEREERSERVPQGKVALSVSSDPEHALGGSLERGDEVDVYLAMDSVADRLMRATVLDTSALHDESSAISWVTLAVDPEMVRELLTATSKGMVWLAEPAEQSDRVDGAPSDDAVTSAGSAGAEHADGKTADGGEAAEPRHGAGAEAKRPERAADGEGAEKRDVDAKKEGSRE